MAGLVLEGGSLRGIFSAGCMDALLDNDIEFNYVIGVSAGITNAASYISKQNGRNLEVIKKYRKDKRYLSFKNLIKTKALFGLDFLFDEVPNKLVPVDRDVYNSFKGKIKIGVTNAHTGCIEYKDGNEMDEKCLLLRASCAIPLASPSIIIEGKEYFDGGIADSIPIKKSIEDGNEKNLVILTQPKGFVKKNSLSVKYSSYFYKRKYPLLAKTIINRANMYNETIKFLEDLKEKETENILIIQPEYSLDSFEKDINVLESTYKHGYDLTVKNIEKIKKLF